jgi:hypothetical protein
MKCSNPYCNRRKMAEFESLIVFGRLAPVRPCNHTHAYQATRRALRIRFGSKADLVLAPVDVGLTPKSGHCWAH